MTKVQFTIYDVLDQKVRMLINEQKTPGRYEARFLDCLLSPKFLSKS